MESSAVLKRGGSADWAPAAFSCAWTAPALCAALAGVLLAGCAGPPPRLFPVAPGQNERLPDGGAILRYERVAGLRGSLAERIDESSRVVELRYDWDRDGSDDLNVPLVTQPGSGPARVAKPHLLLLLDSVPYELVRQMRGQGRFGMFHAPARVISPFPAMTDLSFAEFFGASPSVGVEAEYFDGQKLVNGYDAYARGGNTGWEEHVDYHLWPTAHLAAYTYPLPWFDHELRRIQDDFLLRRSDRFVGYCVGTSALGARDGRNGHVAGLIHVDRLCQWLMFQARGNLDITLLSDHGHNLVRSARIPLTESLAQMGYRVAQRLHKAGDVVVPEFGIVTYASIYTREPERVARDVVNLEGIDLAAYLEPAADRVVVIRRDGSAFIQKSGDTFLYQMEGRDPLGLLSPSGEQKGVAWAEFSDAQSFEMSVDARYPDALHRLWRAFHGLVQYAPDVMISTRDGYHCGSKLMTRHLQLAAAHGSLGSLSSTGFAMTTAGELPPVRMEDLAANLRQLGLDVPSGRQQ